MQEKQDNENCLLESEWKACCCDCKHHVTIYKHPSNKDEYVRGSIMEFLGYICHIGGEDKGIFTDRKHSFCEAFERKGKK
jgi:hypothetical protein